MRLRILFFIFLTFVSYTQNKEAIIDSGNSKLHYKVYGEGEPILIINGGPGMNCEGFGFIASEIAKMNFQTIIYDQRGTGKSTLEETNSNTITLDLMIEDIENLRKHLKIKKWTVLGHSFGGILATYYAKKQPQSISKIIFSSSGGVSMNFTNSIQNRINSNLTKTERDSLTFYVDKIRNGDNSDKTRRLRAKYLSKAYVFDKSKANIIEERLLQANFTVNQIVFQELQSKPFNCVNDFANFNKPVLILQGENDILSLDVAQEIKTSFPNSQLITIRNCGHYGWLDAPTLYFKSIQHFLKS